MSIFTPNNAGTVTFTNGSTAIAGAATLFKGYRAGSVISIPGVGEMQLAADPATDTAAVGVSAWQGATVGPVAFQYLPRNEEGVFTDKLTQLLELIGGGNVLAFAELALAADKLPYANGAGTMALTAFPAWARSMLGLAGAANKLPYLTGANTAALADLSAFARTLLDDTDASTALGTLGVSDFGKALLDDVNGTEAMVTLGVPPLAPQGRLSLVQGVAVPNADVVGATSIFYLPATGDRIPRYDGSAFSSEQFSELELELDATSGHTGYHQSGRNFPLFVWHDGSTIRLGTGPSWDAGAVAGSDTARGTGTGSSELEMHLGQIVNKNDIVLRYGVESGDTADVPAHGALWVGDFRATANGQAEDSARRRLLFNAHNRARRPMMRLEPAINWNYSTATLRQANNNPLNQLEVLIGAPDDAVRCRVQGQMVNSTTTPRVCAVCVGLDSTSLRAADSINGTSWATSQIYANPQAEYFGFPGLGYHYLTWLEYAGGTDVQTWHGTSNIATLLNLGMVGECWA